MKHLKQEFDKLTFKEAIIFSMAYVSLIAGFVLIFVGMFTAPQGEIHESVIYTYGLTLFFVGSLLGISMAFYNAHSRFKSSILDILRANNIQVPPKEASEATSPSPQPSDGPPPTCSAKGTVTFTPSPSTKP